MLKEEYVRRLRICNLTRSTNRPVRRTRRPRKGVDDDHTKARHRRRRAMCRRSARVANRTIQWLCARLQSRSERADTVGARPQHHEEEDNRRPRRGVTELSTGGAACAQAEWTTANEQPGCACAAAGKARRSHSWLQQFPRADQTGCSGSFRRKNHRPGKKYPDCSEPQQSRIPAYP